MARICRHLRIHGCVQGVGFRWSLRAKAQALGLKGWVRNRSDGSVEAHVCGAPESVEALIKWAHQGPSSARVDRVDLREVDPEDDSDFALVFEQRASC